MQLEAGDQDIMLDTTGERIMHLLRQQGRAETGEAYRQADLLAWLTGEQVAPNGKRYEFSISKSHLSQLINEKLENKIVDEYRAIGEIFNVDMEWLLNGNVVGEPEESSDIFMTPEAGEIALLIDRMEAENRQAILYLVKHISRLDNELRQSDYELAKILARNIDGISTADRSRARLLLAQIQRNRSEPRDLGATAK
jgi:DNA-binding transcriptional ArsR family regulator